MVGKVSLTPMGGLVPSSGFVCVNAQECQGRHTDWALQPRDKEQSGGQGMTGTKGTCFLTTS